MMREKMKGWFSHTLSTCKILNLKAKETWGQLTARFSISKHSKDGVVSKANHKTHNHPKHTHGIATYYEFKQREGVRKYKMSSTNKTFRTFMNVSLFGILSLSH